MTTTVTDVVGIYDEDLQPLVENLQPIKASVTRSSKVMEHPLEDGSTVSDHRVFQPVEIEMTAALFPEDYARLREVFTRTETVTVRTKAGTFDSMIIETLPHDETIDAFDMIVVAIKLREVVFVETQFQALPPRAAGGRSNSNTSTAKRGEQSAKPAGADRERRASVLYRALGLGGGG